jgi:2-polyprenyl-3-methyl-5-hydroxy-6-metoxy-1,4-benzoquinol methylase
MQTMNCRLCSASAIKSLYQINGCKILKCNQCGVVFAMVDSRKVNLSDLYLNYRSDAVIVKQIEHNAEIARGFLKETKTLGFEYFDRMLDVGCGLGFFLRAMTKYVGDCVGEEISDYQVSFANNKLGVKVLKGELTELALSKESFDVITMWDVIEHLSSPLDCLEECHRLLRENGLIAISTPNYNSLTRMIVGEKWLVFNPPEHMFYFTPSTLIGALNKAGFRTLRVSTKGINAYNVLQARNVSKETRQKVWRKKSMELHHPAGHRSALKQLHVITVDRILNLLRIGDQITIYAIKE